MKILIIDGGFRKGNTWKLTTLVKEQINSFAQDIQFEEVHLKDLDLPFCVGCSQCFRKGHNHCPHNAIVQSIMDKIEESDGVIVSAPTYNMQVPALTKNWIDHMCYMLHRPRYFTKKGLVISTTGGVGVKKVTKYVAGTLIGWGFNRCYQLPISAISWNDYQPTEKDLRKSTAIAKKFYEDVMSKKMHSPSFSSVLCFNLFRGMSIEYRKGTEFETKDGTFWEQEGYDGVTFSPQIPMPIHKKLFGSMFFVLAKMMSKKMAVTYKK